MTETPRIAKPMPNFMRYRWMWLSCETRQEFACLTLLNNSRPEMEGEHGSAVSLLLVNLDWLWLPPPHGRLRRVSIKDRNISK